MGCGGSSNRAPASEEPEKSPERALLRRDVQTASFSSVSEESSDVVLNRDGSCDGGTSLRASRKGPMSTSLGEPPREKPFRPVRRNTSPAALPKLAPKRSRSSPTVPALSTKRGKNLAPLAPLKSLDSKMRFNKSLSTEVQTSPRFTRRSKPEEKYWQHLHHKHSLPNCDTLRPVEPPTKILPPPNAKVEMQWKELHDSISVRPTSAKSSGPPPANSRTRTDRRASVPLPDTGDITGAQTNSLGRACVRRLHRISSSPDAAALEPFESRRHSDMTSKEMSEIRQVRSTTCVPGIAIGQLLHKLDEELIREVRDSTPRGEEGPDDKYWQLLHGKHAGKSALACPVICHADFEESDELESHSSDCVDDVH